MSRLDAVIEARAAQAIQEIQAMAKRAQEATRRGFVFVAKSNGQRFRWAKRRGQA